MINRNCHCRKFTAVEFLYEDETNESIKGEGKQNSTCFYFSSLNLMSILWTSRLTICINKIKRQKVEITSKKQKGEDKISSYFQYPLNS